MQLCPFNLIMCQSFFHNLLFILVLGSATGPMSIEAEPASLASYSSLGSSNFPMDSSIAEFEMARKHAQRQCGRFGKNVEISSNITWPFCHILVFRGDRWNFPPSATSRIFE